MKIALFSFIFQVNGKDIKSHQETLDSLKRSTEKTFSIEVCKSNKRTQGSKSITLTMKSPSMEAGVQTDISLLEPPQTSGTESTLTLENSKVEFQNEEFSEEDEFLNPWPGL